jgi:hypothetical protein
MHLIRGIVHGKTIELDAESGYPDGQPVTVIVQRQLPPGEGIRQAAGSWADGGDGLDRWFQAIRASRNTDRLESEKLFHD